MTDRLRQTISCFSRHEDEISSLTGNLKSSIVLSTISSDLSAIGYKVGGTPTRAKTVPVPVCEEKTGQVITKLKTCAYHVGDGISLYVEAGRGFTNYEFLHDIIEASMMSKVRHACVAVRRQYKGSDDFEKVRAFLTALYASGGVRLSLDTTLIIGY